jgi:hypothetical protein
MQKSNQEMRMDDPFAERLRKSRDVKGMMNASFLISQDRATGLWHWVLESEDSGPVARSATCFKTRELLLDDLRRIQSKAPQSLIFDLIGNLQHGA